MDPSQLAQSWLQLIMSTVASSMSFGFPGYRQQCIIWYHSHAYVILHIVTFDCTLLKKKIINIITCRLKWVYTNGPPGDWVHWVVSRASFVWLSSSDVRTKDRADYCDFDTWLFKCFGSCGGSSSVFPMTEFARDKRSKFYRNGPHNDWVHVVVDRLLCR